MSGSIAKAGAAYEAVLVDKVTAKADAIVAAVQRLETAFNGVKNPAADFNQSMQGISAAMRSASREVADRSQSAFNTVGRTMISASKTIATAGQSIGQTFIHIGNQIRNMGLLASGLSGGIFYGFLSSVREFSEAEGILASFNAVFEGTSGDMNKWVDEFSTAMGRSGKEVRKNLIVFKSMFSQLDLGAETIDAMSMRMQQLSLDLAAAFELTDAEAFTKLSAALRAEADPIESVGVLVSDNMVKTSEWGKRIIETSGALTDQDKILVRYAMLLDQTEKHEGAAARETEQWANQVKKLQAALAILKQRIGSLVIEDFTRGIQTVTAAVSKMKDWDGLGDFLKTLQGAAIAIGVFAGVAVVLGTALSVLGPPIIGATTAFGALGAIIGGVALSPILAIPAAMVAAGAAMSLFFSYLVVRNFDVTQALADLSGMFARLKTYASGAGDILRESIELGDWSTVWETIKLTGEVAFRDLANTIVLVLGDALKGGIMAAFELLKDVTVLGPTGAVNKYLSSIGNIADDNYKGWEDATNRLTQLQIAANQRRNTRLENQPEPPDIPNLPGMDDLFNRVQAALLGIENKPMSSGSFSAAYAADIGNFSPAMEPIERNQERQIDQLSDIAKQSSNAAKFLKDISEKPGMVFE